MRGITVLIAPDGSSTVEAYGFAGAACLKATKDIEDAIGRVDARKPTREMGTVTNVHIVEQG